MDSIFRGDLVSARGRRNAWVDALFVDHALLRLVWGNFGTVVPGRLYRSNHPTPGRLAGIVRRHGVRSVVNLRGRSGNGADALSRAAAVRLGVTVLDVPFRSSEAPSRDSLLALVAALQRAEAPTLLHCKSGADRAGFAAGVAVLLAGGATADAVRHLSLRHGHLRRSRAGILDAVFLAWRETGEGRMEFPAWVAGVYDPAALARPRAGRFAGVLQERVLARE